MSAVVRPKRMDELMEAASRALARTAYFEAERKANEALRLAHQAKDYDRMARIALPLQEARRQRYQLALDTGQVIVVRTPMGEEPVYEPGCYLFVPPLVAADARRFRIGALEREVPVAVACREPATIIKLCPIVAIGPGVTVRTKVDSPKGAMDRAPDLAWFVAALRALGDSAIEGLDPALALTKRLDQLLARLDVIPEHDELHQAVADTCRALEASIREGAAATG